MHLIAKAVEYFLAHWGYLAVIVGILGEDVGLPLPGETVLISASFLARKGELTVYWLIPVAIVAAVVGDNTGYLLGEKFGKFFVRWLSKIAHLDDEDIRAAKDLIRRRGGTTIFFARFIIGLRTVAGILAGALGMEWRRFFICNALGATAWVVTMSLAGYAFGASLRNFTDYFEYVSWSLSGGLFLTGYLIWKKHKKSFERRDHKHHQHRHRNG